MAVLKTDEAPPWTIHTDIFAWAVQKIEKQKKIAKWTWTEECFIACVMRWLSSVKDHVCLWKIKGTTWSLVCSDWWWHWFVLNRGTKSRATAPLDKGNANSDARLQTNWGLPLSQQNGKLSIRPAPIITGDWRSLCSTFSLCICRQGIISRGSLLRRLVGEWFVIDWTLRTLIWNYIIHSLSWYGIGISDF